MSIALGAKLILRFKKDTVMIFHIGSVRDAVKCLSIRRLMPMMI